MKRIAQKLEIDITLTTYVARHSFSTVLKWSGAPIEFISEALGHHDTKTTGHYLDSFEDSVKQQYSQFLLAFNKYGDRLVVLDKRSLLNPYRGR